MVARFAGGMTVRRAITANVAPYRRLGLESLIIVVSGPNEWLGPR
jgi:hypothetical protein